MANYFVSTTRGNDTTGDGSASNPWATISKAIGATPAITPGAGDVLYIEPGTYRETVSIGISPTSEFKIVGDVDGTGFYTGGYTTPATGYVIWTAWTSDTGAAPTTIHLNTNSKNYLTFQFLIFYGANVSSGSASIGTSQNIKFYRCYFKAGIMGSNNPMISITTTDGTASNITFDKCRLMANTAYPNIIQITATSSATAEYNFNILVRDCAFLFGAGGVVISKGGANSFYAYGLTIQNCLFAGQAIQAILIYSGDTHAMTASPANTVYGSRFIGQYTALQAGATSQLTEDGNHIYARTPRTAVSTGANSVSNQNAPLFAFEEQELIGIPLRQFMSPSSGSWALGWGSYGTPDTIDITGRARPEGGGSLSPAVGPIERHDTAALETSTVQAGTSSWKLAGPSSQIIQIALDAVATTISIYAYADTNHGSGTPPQVQLLANYGIGVAAQTVTMTANTGTWNQITLNPITPTAKGVVLLQLVSRPTVASGIAYFDSLAFA